MKNDGVKKNINKQNKAKQNKENTAHAYR